MDKQRQRERLRDLTVTQMCCLTTFSKYILPALMFKPKWRLKTTEKVTQDDRMEGEATGWSLESTLLKKLEAKLSPDV